MDFGYGFELKTTKITGLNCNIWIIYINRFNLFNRTKFILMRAVTKKWVFLKISSLILVPLMLWFI